MKSTTFPIYYQPYIDRVPEGDPLELMQYSLNELLRSLVMITEEDAAKAYAEGKWTIKDLVQHIIDTERIFSYRALSFARKDNNEINGYDHDSYVKNAGASERSLKSLLEELKRLRASTIDLFTSFTEEMMLCGGMANGQKLSVSQIQYILIGHEMHHLSIIHERYL